MVRIKIGEVEGTVDIEEMHDLQQKLQMLNKELSQAKDDQLQLQKRIKSSEVGGKKYSKMKNMLQHVYCIRFRVNPAV